MSYNSTIRFADPPKGFTVGFLGPEPVSASEADGREQAARELGKDKTAKRAGLVLAVLILVIVVLIIVGWFYLNA